MRTDLSPYALGATLYMPATRDDIASIIINKKIPELRSLVICIEDAVTETDIPKALSNVRTLLADLQAARRFKDTDTWPLLFIRPRNPEMGKLLVRDFDLSLVAGFVLPKFTLQCIPKWSEFLCNSHLCWMPTLETEEAFDVNRMHELATALENHPCRNKILALRIGGNDLMNVVSLRRSRSLTLYDGPLGYVIKMLVAVFGAKGFPLTAPVFEHIDDQSLLDKEITLDLAHGLVGKTAIHPNQVHRIQQAMMVGQADHEDALRILNSSVAVFKSRGAMCEPSTHKRWASSILSRAAHFGIASETAAGHRTKLRASTPAD